MSKADPNRNPRHSLSAIDVKKMTAICAVCGPTDIRKRRNGQYTVYICAIKKLKYAREYRLQRFHPNPIGMAQRIGVWSDCLSPSYTPSLLANA